MRRTTSLAMATLMMAGCSGGSPKLAKAYEDCEAVEEAVESSTLSSMSGIRVSDDGRSISFDGKAEILNVVCVLTILDVPDAVVTRMDHTRALDGAQEATWDDLSAWWTYHPDAGLNLVIEQVRN